MERSNSYATFESIVDVSTEQESFADFSFKIKRLFYRKDVSVFEEILLNTTNHNNERKFYKTGYITNFCLANNLDINSYVIHKEILSTNSMERCFIIIFRDKLLLTNDFFRNNKNIIFSVSYELVILLFIPQIVEIRREEENNQLIIKSFDQDNTSTFKKMYVF